MIKGLRPVSPGASWFGPGSHISSMTCSATAPPVKITFAKDTLQRFCTDHQDIAQGGNFSSYYDAGEDDMRLFFNVFNECAPNGVYLPLDACVNGFTAPTRCPGGYGSDLTSLAQASGDCLSFDFYDEAIGSVAGGGDDDGLVVT
jgi:hypothetical protein